MPEQQRNLRLHSVHRRIDDIFSENSDLEIQKVNLEQEINRLHEQLATQKRDESEHLDAIATLEAQATALKNEKEVSEEAIANLNAQARALQDKAKTYNTTITRLNEQNNIPPDKVHRLHTQRNIKAQDLEDATNRISSLEKIGKRTEREREKLNTCLHKTEELLFRFAMMDPEDLGQLSKMVKKVYWKEIVDDQHEMAWTKVLRSFEPAWNKDDAVIPRPETYALRRKMPREMECSEERGGREG